MRKLTWLLACWACGAGSPAWAQTQTPMKATFLEHRVEVVTNCFESDRTWKRTYVISEAQVDLAAHIPMSVTCGPARAAIPRLSVTVNDGSMGTFGGSGQFTSSVVLTSYAAGVTLLASNAKDPSEIGPINAFAGGNQCTGTGKATRVGTTSMALTGCVPVKTFPMTYDFTLRRYLSFGITSYVGGYIASGTLADAATGRADISVTITTVFNTYGNADVPANSNGAGRPTDSRFVGLNPSNCRKRSEGPLKVPVKINRVVGEVDGSGELVDYLTLVGSGVLFETAKLRLATFHRNLLGTALPNVDGVRINGKDFSPDGGRATIYGANETWTVSEFQVPIQFLRFGRRTPGELSTANENVVELSIDQGSPLDEENWCAATDWAEITISALYPTVMVHGNGQGDDGKGGDFWDGAVLGDKDRLQMPFKFSDAFKKRQVPYYNKINMYTDTIAVHGDLLAALVLNAAAEFGAKHVHMVAHSKGGLDSRDFLVRTIPKNFGVLSLTTISTPHHGSPGPDYQIDSVGASAAYSDDSTRTIIGVKSPPNKGTASIRVSGAEAFNAANAHLLPTQFTVDGEINSMAYRSISADMNLDDSTSVFGNPTISIDETVGLPGQKELGVYDWIWASLLEQAYRLVGGVASTFTEQKTIIINDPDTGALISVEVVTVVREVPNPAFLPNDICVSFPGATIDPFVRLATLKANHSTVVSESTGYIVLDSLRAIQPVKQP